MNYEVWLVGWHGIAFVYIMELNEERDFTDIMTTIDRIIMIQLINNAGSG